MDIVISAAIAMLLDDSIRSFGETLNELGDLVEAGAIAFPTEDAEKLFGARKKRWVEKYKNLADRYTKLSKERNPKDGNGE